MKKSFAENCIRYISTATALILALAMLCCANFSAGAKNLGSNLTISDTTLLLKDINTTTNTTPAKTKDLIASGAGVELLSTGIRVGDTIYFRCTKNYSAVFAYIWYRDSNNTNYEYTAWASSPQMTSMGSIDGKYYYSYTLTGDKTYDFNYVLFKSDQDTKITSNDVAITSGMNCYDLDDTSWSTYSGGSSGTTNKTVYFDNSVSKWENVYAWVWNSGSNGESVKLTRVGTTDVYSMKVSTDKDCVIFKQNSGNDFNAPRTGNLLSSLLNNMADGYMFSFTDYSSTSAQNTGTWTKYSVATTYTVTFNANGHGTDPPSQTVTSGGTATAPTAPTATGYTFGGWYTDESLTIEATFPYTVTSNVTFYAKWTAISTEDITVYFDNSVTQWENVYLFYWNNDKLSEIYDGNALKGKGTGVKYKTISNVTSQLLSVDVPYNTTYIAFTSFNGNTSGTMDNYDNFYGTGEKEFIACYYTNSSDNKFTLDNNTHKFSSSKTVFRPSGNTESNKYNNETKYINGTWSEYTVPKHTVTFDYKEHGGTTETQLVTDGQCATQPTPAPTADGYSFGGWYRDSACQSAYDFSTPVTSNLILHAKWTANQYTVSFNSNGGDDTPDSITVTYGGTYAGLPTSAGIKTGHKFAGWYTSATGGKEVKSSDVVKITSDQTLYAHWTAKEYTITYMSEGSQLSGLTPTQYTYGVGVDTLPTPSKEGYTFVDWYENEGLTGDPVTSISTDATENKTFYAKWEASKYSITYMSGSDTLSGLEPLEYTYGVGVDTLPTPTKNGYRFVGWYDNLTFTGNAVSSISDTETGNKTLYAKWIQKYIFLDVSGLGWFYNDGCEGVVFFNTDNVGDTTTGYTVMTELYTDNSAYETSTSDGKTPHSKLLFVEVPTNITNITKITFARHGAQNNNITEIAKDSFGANNCFKMTGGGGNNGAINGEWSTVDYTPVPINFNVGENGKVYLINTKIVDMPVAIGRSTIYADKSATSLKIKATPDAENGYELNTLKVNGVNKAGDISGGTVNVGTLVDNNTVEVTFKASQSPKIIVPTEPTVANSTIKLTYTDPENETQTGTEFDTEYTIKYNSTFTLEITPASGYYVESLGENLTPTDTFPKAGIITATQTGTGVKDVLLSLKYVIKANPKVTIEVPDSEYGKVDFTYTNDNGDETTAHTAGTYSVYYDSDITYKVNPKDGYYVATITGVTTQSPTPPVAEAVTGSISNIIADVTDTITCTINPNPTVKVICCDTDGTELGAEKVTLKFGTTDIISSEGKKVTYNSDTANTFTATAVSEDEYHFSGFYTQRPTVSSPVSDDNKITTTEISTDDYKTSAAENVLTVKNVKNDVTFYAVFSQLYRVEFIFSNLEKFTIDGSDKIGNDPIVSGSCVYVAKGAILSLKATVGDDYQLKKSSWTYTDKKGVLTFNNDSAEDVTYKVAGNSTITITPQIATYTGEGKWGSKTLKIDTSGVNSDTPWFAVAFKKSETDADNYFIRCSKVSDDLYECVIPDGYTHFDVYRMATGAKSFTTDVEESTNLKSTKAWNVTNTTTKIGTKTSYKLSFIDNQITMISISEK